MNEREKEIIVQEVLRRLSDGGWDQALGQRLKQDIYQALGNVKPLGIVLLDQPADDELGVLRKQYSSHYDLQVWQGEELATKLTFESLSKPGDVFLLGLSLKSVADLALGFRHTNLTEAVTQMLLAGFKIRVVSGEHLPVSCPTSYRAMIEEYCARLCSFGVSFGEGYPISGPYSGSETESAGQTKTESYCQTKAESGVQTKAESDFPIKVINANTMSNLDRVDQSGLSCRVFAGRLLTARDVGGIANQTILRVVQGTLITALARDEAKDRAIEICEVSPNVFG